MEDTTTSQETLRTALVIEDDSLIIEMITMKLEESDIHAEIAMDGNTAIPKILEFDPNVIVLDLMLPGKSGEEILTELKQSDTLKDIPVIVFTNKNREENEAKLLELGAAKFMVKATTDLNDLVTEIKALAE